MIIVSILAAYTTVYIILAAYTIAYVIHVVFNIVCIILAAFTIVYHHCSVYHCVYHTCSVNHCVYHTCSVYHCVYLKWKANEEILTDEIVDFWMEESSFKSFPMLGIALFYILAQTNTNCLYINCNQVNNLRHVYPAHILPSNGTSEEFHDRYVQQIQAIDPTCKHWSLSPDGWFGAPSDLVSELPGSSLCYKSMRALLKGT